MAFIDWDSDAHRWVPLRWDAGSDRIDFETSPDAQSWTSFHTMNPTTFGFDQATFELGGGAWDAPFSADPFVAFDNAFLCDE